jgi:Tannase and feruloyl esterase
MPKIILVAVVVVLMACRANGQATTSGTHSCEGLAQLEMAGAKTVLAQTVAAGAFMPPAKMSRWLVGDPSFYKTLPAFCRLVVDATPSADSSIKIEVWMPLSGSQHFVSQQVESQDVRSPGEAWNGKFQGEGIGGFAGEIDYRLMATGLRRDFATAGTNTGHSAEGTDASWALGHPEKVIDFGYRGIHEMTRVAKLAIAAFYGKAPRYSYFEGCSNGGRQALMEAQRFPDDYDGILAGAPANFWTHLLVKGLADAQATTLDPASYIPSSKLPAIAHAVNAACDSQDGVADGILNDPRKCRFDPATMLCKESDSEKCLTAAQATALKKLYDGPNDAQGRKIFPGYLPGGEEGPEGWARWITGPAPGQSLIFAFTRGYFSDMVYDQAGWNYQDPNVDQSLKAADEKTALILNATNANLAPFKAHGGKLIIYHGWNDPAISALNTVNYYEEVVSKLGAKQAEAFTRLYMVPGMQHCTSGPGPDSFGQLGSGGNDAQHNVELALEQWVEKGVAPNAIIATKYAAEGPTKEVKMTRPLCAFPQVAKYKGAGDTNDAKNFVCGADGK